MQWLCFFLQFFSISYGSAIVVENESWHSHSPNSFHRHRFSLSDDTTSRFFLSARSVVKLDYFLRRDRTHPLCFLNFPGIFPFLRHNLWPFLVYYDQKKKKKERNFQKNVRNAKSDRRNFYQNVYHESMFTRVVLLSPLSVDRYSARYGVWNDWKRKHATLVPRQCYRCYAVNVRAVCLQPVNLQPVCGTLRSD